MTTTVEGAHDYQPEKPGVKLTKIREKKGYSLDYVASKLCLRVKIIQMLEEDDYSQMPEPVFIKGYLRSYAKLLGIDAEPLLAYFNSLPIYETPKVPKALWQTTREPHNGIILRWAIGITIFILVIVFSLWWYKDKQVDNAKIVSEENKHPAISLTDLSKMQVILSAKPKKTSLELYSG